MVKTFLFLREHMNNLWKAHSILLLTALIGAFNYSISKIVMPDYVRPSAIILIRGGCSIIFFWMIHFIFIREKITDKNDYLKLLLCAVFGITANQILFYEGLNLTTPINASLLQCGVPLFVIIVAAITLKEKITLLKIAGLVLGATGAVLLLIHSSNSRVTGTHAGDVMVLLNALSYGIFLVLVKPLTEKYDPFTVVKWVFLFGTIMSIPFGYNQLQQVQWNTIPTHVWLSLGYIVLFATIINYYLNVGVLRYVNTSVAGIYIYLQPVFTGIIAISWGKDMLSWEKLIYSLLIFGGVYLVSFKAKNEKSKAESLHLKNNKG
jgi:drug/metabolite transporter (DMT)-like permease